MEGGQGTRRGGKGGQGAIIRTDENDEDMN